MIILNVFHAEHDAAILVRYLKCHFEYGKKALYLKKIVRYSLIKSKNKGNFLGVTI